MTVVLASTTAATAYEIALLVLLACWLRMTARWTCGPRPRRLRRPPRSRSTEPYPDDFATVDRMLRSSSMSARRHHFGLRPLLRELAESRLAPHERADPAALARLGVDTVLDDRAAPDGGLERGPELGELERLVGAVEQLERR